MKNDPADRLSEGWTLDYKEQWSDDMLKHVAAFANTFGGLLLVGVSEKNGKPEEIIGVQTKTELKTQIASSIAANVTPTPSYDIGECLHPKDGTKHVSVLRIRNVNQLHYYLKGDKPVYIRNADQSRPANAIQLRALIEQRTREAEAVDFSARLSDLSRGFFIETRKDISSQQRTRSQTYLIIFIQPRVRQRLIPFDASVERLIAHSIVRQFPEIGVRWNSYAAMRPENRGRDWYQVDFWESSTDFEMKWLITERMESCFVSQVRVPISGHGPCWSLADVLLNLAFAIRNADAIWGTLGFFGECDIACQLKVGDLKLYQEQAGFFQDSTTPTYASCRA